MTWQTRQYTGETGRVTDTISLAADLVVHRPRAAALAAFTPEGERTWVPDWEPEYPAPDRRVGPGAVFRTSHGERTTTWVVVDQDDGGVRYARVTPEVSAGTVAVSVLLAEPTQTRLRVSYDLTALSPAGRRELDAFAADYPAYMAGWRRRSGARMRTGSGRRGPPS